MRLFHGLAAILFAAGLAACSPSEQPGSQAPGAADKTAMPAATPAAAVATDPANTAVLELKSGRVVIKLRPDIAPKHVERVKQLMAEGFYNGLKFHRVIPGFMAQTGDPKGTGEGGSKYPNLPAEFTQTDYVRGTIGAARTNDPNTANSQFFICFNSSGCSFLKGKYTVFGEVVSGMEHVDKIAQGEPPAAPDVIVKMSLAQ